MVLEPCELRLCLLHLFLPMSHMPRRGVLASFLRRRVLGGSCFLLMPLLLRFAIAAMPWVEDQKVLYVHAIASCLHHAACQANVTELLLPSQKLGK
ncbi:nitrosoguanidine resistance protein SNG1 [Sesbania bispinosa]|nr:nitrosoguanidine resistance protein SNG1 [Sesbania bispinosa]